MMDDDGGGAAAHIAAAVGEPARARMLYRLMDGHAQTSTELAIVAEVGPSTASAHLKRLTDAGLVKVAVRGKHRHYSLAGREVARLLERLSVLASATRKTEPAKRIRIARSCFDHLAGAVGVALHDRLHALGYLARDAAHGDGTYSVTESGIRAFRTLGIDVAETSALRRRFAYGCLDWTERRAHLAGALGAAVLDMALQRKWFFRDLDSRALEFTAKGRSELASRFGVKL